MNSFSFQVNDELDSEIYKQLESLCKKSNTTLSSRTNINNKLDYAYDIIKYNLNKKTSIPVDEVDYFIFGINRNKDRDACSKAKKYKSLDMDRYDADIEESIARESSRIYESVEDTVLLSSMIASIEEIKAEVYFKYEADLSECIKLAKCGIPQCIEVLREIAKDESLGNFLVYIIENNIEIGGIDYAKIFRKKRSDKILSSKVEGNERQADRVHFALCNLQLFKDEGVRHVAKKPLLKRV